MPESEALSVQTDITLNFANVTMLSVSAVYLLACQEVNISGDFSPLLLPPLLYA